MSLKFQIGDELWYAAWEVTSNYVTCPDCGGTGRIRVIHHDDTEMSIECAGCSAGYEPPKGYVTVYDRKALAYPVTITGVEIRDGKAQWRSDRHYIPEEGDLYRSEAEAIAGAQVKAAKADREERERIAKKEKPTRTWSWNAHYHRKEIKRAQQSIEYHTKKLAAANLKARVEKASTHSQHQRGDQS